MGAASPPDIRAFGDLHFGIVLRIRRSTDGRQKDE
jgi:hypothetical protein